MGYANVFNYQIFKFYMHEITCTLLTLTVHEYYTETTCILCACRCCNSFDPYCGPKIIGVQDTCQMGPRHQITSGHALLMK